jgi:G-patch domain
MGAMRTLPATLRTRLFRKPIHFQEETQTDSSEKESSNSDRGELIASFYRSITGPITEPSSPEVINLDSSPEPSEVCPTCNLPLPSSASLKRKHYCTTAHLAKVVDHRPPLVNPLHIDKSSYGYKVLLSQGWNDKDSKGIGAADNKGRREPVKASRVKNDTVGLGIKVKKGQQEGKEKKLIPSGKEIREAYERDKRIRKEWFEYMSR